MGLMDVLRQYTSNAGAPDAMGAHAQFDEVAQSAPQGVLGQGVADAFRADSTPPFGEMVGDLFGKSDPQQRAGLLNHLIQAIGPGVLSALGGGILGRLAGSTPGIPVTPEQAAQVTPAQVQEVATHAEQHDPGIVDKVGDFYAGHPQLVKTLGSAALAIALAGVASRMQR
jgi:hypothetical protein